MAIGVTSNMEWLSGPGGSGSVEYTAVYGRYYFTGKG